MNEPGGSARNVLDSELSEITWTRRDRHAVLSAVKDGGMVMKKKASTVFALAVTLVLLTVGALAAAGVIFFSSKADSAALADKALESAYGITPAMQTYFTRSVREGADETVVTYSAIEVFGYALGDYTVTIKGDKATAAWSWDGTPVKQGFDEAPWGAEQLEHMLDTTRKTQSYSEFYLKAASLAEAAGISAETRAEPTDEEFEAIRKAQKETRAIVEARMKLTPDELTALGREALIEREGFTPEMLAYLEYIEGNESYGIDDGDKPCMSLRYGFGYVEGLFMGDSHTEWENLYGIYTVTINVETGVIEYIHFDSGLAGNG